MAHFKQLLVGIIFLYTIDCRDKLSLFYYYYLLHIVSIISRVRSKIVALNSKKLLYKNENEIFRWAVYDSFSLYI
jgi:hypothetical protein